MALPSNIKDEIWAAAKKYAKSKGYKEIGYASIAYEAGATEYAVYKERCEKALEYINKMQCGGWIELSNEHINEIKSFLDGTK